MPHFTIEALGETRPLSKEAILSVLTTTTNGLADQQSLQVATQQISNWEVLPGYYSRLQDIYIDLSLSHGIRFQAIIQLKNGIDKHWRKTSHNAIGKAEKEKIRSRAIEAGVQEPEPALALQNSLMLAKIVRYEFPHDWPDVITIIIHHIRAVNRDPTQTLYTSNTLMIALQIIKELASGRLQRTKRSLQQVASEFLQTLGSLFVDLIDRWRPSSENVDIATARNSHSALKTLRRLLVVGFEHPHREHDVVQFWSLLRQYFLGFWESRLTTVPTEYQKMTLRHLLQLSKLNLEMARNHPASFVLLNSSQILTQSWNIINDSGIQKMRQDCSNWQVQREGDTKEDSPMDKLCLKALLLFRACIKMVFNPAHTFRYQTPEDKTDRKSAVDQVKDSVFTVDFVLRLMELLVTHYFILQPADLRDWQEEPDEWEKREEEIADAWEFSTRSCSEKLFLDLVINFKELVVPKLLQVFQQYAILSNTEVLLKDSLYSAVGIAAACLENVLDFNSFLRNTLVPEVQMTNPHYNLLRRRTAILLGQWIPVKPESIDRIPVYQIFTYLLSQGDHLNDHVVQVTAGRQLRLILEPFEFNYDHFAPYATPILQSLMTLVSETELTETKMALLETVRVAVTKLEGHIEPYADDIMSMLPPLWAESGEEHLMKQEILTMITAIVNSLGQKSLAYHAPILPLIRDSVRPESEAVVYLLEEALDLWETVIQQTPLDCPPPSDDLLQLSRSILPLLEMGGENLGQCFEIIQSYIYLSPATILAPNILITLLESLKALLPMLSSSRARDASSGPAVIENLVSTISSSLYFPPDTQNHAIKHLLSALVDTGYLGEVLRIVKEAHEYHQDPRPNRRPPDVIGPGETSLLTLLSRLALLSPNLLVQAIEATGNSLDWLIIEWIAHFDAIGDVLRKKLQTLAVTNFLISANPPPRIMLEQLQSLMTVWTDIATELGEEAGEESQGDYLWTNRPAELPEWPDATPEDGRKRHISNIDPIYAVNIRSFIADRLKQTVENCGGAARFEQEWLSRIDSAALKSFVDLKILWENDIN